MSGIFRSYSSNNSTDDSSYSNRPPPGPTRSFSSASGAAPAVSAAPAPAPSRGPSPGRTVSPGVLSRGNTPPSRRSSPSPQRTITNVDEYGGSCWAEVSMPPKEKSFRGLSEVGRRRSMSPSIHSSSRSLVSTYSVNEESITSASFVHDDDDDTQEGKDSSLSESTGHGGYSAAGIRVGGPSTNLLPNSRRRPGQGNEGYGSGSGNGNPKRQGSTAPPPQRGEDDHYVQAQRHLDDTSHSSALSADRAAGAKAIPMNKDRSEEYSSGGIYGQKNGGGLSELQIQAAQLAGDESSIYTGTTLTRSDDLNSRVKSVANQRKNYASSVRSGRSNRSHTSWRSGRSAASSSSFFSQISDQVSDTSKSGESDNSGEEGSIPSDGSSVKSASELENIFHKPNNTQRDVAHLSQSSRWNAQSTRSGSLRFLPGSQAAMAQQWKAEPQAIGTNVLNSLTDAGKEHSSVASAKALGRKVGNRNNARTTAIGRSSTGGVTPANRYGGTVGATVTTRKQAAASIAETRLSTIESLSQSTGVQSKSSASGNSSSIPSNSSGEGHNTSSLSTGTGSIITESSQITENTRNSGQSADTSRSASSYDAHSRSDNSREESRSSRSRTDSEYSSGTRSYSTQESPEQKAAFRPPVKQLSTVYSETDSANQSSSATDTRSGRYSEERTRSDYDDRSYERSRTDGEHTYGDEDHTYGDDRTYDDEQGSHSSRESYQGKRRTHDVKDVYTQENLEHKDEDMIPTNIPSRAQKRYVDDDEETQETADTEDKKARHAYRVYADKLRYNSTAREDSGNSVVSSVLSDLPKVPPREQGLVSNDEDRVSSAGRSSGHGGSEISQDLSMYDQESHLENSLNFDDHASLMESGKSNSARSFMTEMTDMTESQVLTPIMSKQEEQEFKQRKEHLDLQREMILNAAAAAGITKDRDSVSLTSHTTQQNSIQSHIKDLKLPATPLPDRSSALAAPISSAATLEAQEAAEDYRRETNKGPYNPYSISPAKTNEDTTSSTASSLVSSGTSVKKEPLIIDHERKKTMLQSLSDLHRLQKVVSDLTIPADLESTHGSVRSGLSYAPSLITEDESSRGRELSATSPGQTMNRISERPDSSSNDHDHSTQTSDVSNSISSAGMSRDTFEVKHRINDELAACKELLEGTKRAQELSRAGSIPGAEDTDGSHSSTSDERVMTTKGFPSQQTKRRNLASWDGDAAAGTPLYDDGDEQESDSGWTSDSSSSRRSKKLPPTHVPFQKKSLAVMNEENRISGTRGKPNDNINRLNEDDLDVDFPDPEKRASFRRDAPQAMAIAAAVANAARDLGSADSDSEQEDHDLRPSADRGNIASRTFESSEPHQSSYDDSLSQEYNSVCSQSSVESSSMASRERRPLRKGGSVSSRGSTSTQSRSQEHKSHSAHHSSASSRSGGKYSRVNVESDDESEEVVARDENGRILTKETKKSQLQTYGFADEGMIAGSDDDSTEYDEEYNSSSRSVDLGSRRAFMKNFSSRFNEDEDEGDISLDGDVEVGLPGKQKFSRTTIGNPLDDASDTGKKRRKKNGCCQPCWKPLVILFVLIGVISAIIAGIFIPRFPPPDPPPPSEITDKADTEVAGVPVEPQTGPPVVLNSGEEEKTKLPSEFSIFEWKLQGNFEDQSIGFPGDGYGTRVELSSRADFLAVGSELWGNGVLDEAGFVSIYKTGVFEGSTDSIIAQASGHSAHNRFGSALSINDNGNVIAVGSFLVKTQGEDIYVTGYNVTVFSVTGAVSNQRLLQVDIDSNATSGKLENSTQTFFDVPILTGLSPIGEPIIIDLKNFAMPLMQHTGPGVTVSLSGSGERLAVGVPYYGGTGAVFVYERLDGKSEWISMDISSNLLSRASSGDMYGMAIKISGNGHVLAAGQPRRGDGGRGILYKLEESTTWKSTSFFTSSDMGPGGSYNSLVKDFGSSLDLSYNGSVIAIGAPSSTSVGGIEASGYVAVFQDTINDSDEGSNYVLLGTVLSGDNSNEHFGQSVSLSADGSRLAVGAPHRQDNDLMLGATLIFELSTDRTNWNIAPALYGHGIGSDAGYAVSISHSGATVATGLPYISSCVDFDVCEESGTTRLYIDPSVGSEANITST